MPRIYKLSRAGIKLLYKIRHHRGHGIHSPFVFNLITKVIEEKAHYHSYDDIRFVLDSLPQERLRLNKHNRLMFRLANYFGVKKVLEIGSGYGVNTLCLTAPSSDIECTCVEISEQKAALARKLLHGWDRKIEFFAGGRLPVLQEKQDCIFIDLNNCGGLPEDINSYLSELSYEKTFIIVKGIRTNKHYQALWKGIMNMESRTAVLDLFNMGILFFDKKLYRWNYQISF